MDSKQPCICYIELANNTAFISYNAITEEWFTECIIIIIILPKQSSDPVDRMFLCGQLPTG